MLSQRDPARTYTANVRNVLTDLHPSAIHTSDKRKTLQLWTTRTIYPSRSSGERKRASTAGLPARRSMLCSRARERPILAGAHFAIIILTNSS